jgi:hypothetical protein
MEDVDIAFVWDSLMKTVELLMKGEGDQETHTWAAQAGIIILLEYPPADILRLVKASDLPDKPTIKWMLYEAGRIDGPEHPRIQALMEYWNEHEGPMQGIIAPESLHVPWER